MDFVCVSMARSGSYAHCWLQGKLVKGMPGEIQAKINIGITHVQGPHTARTITSHARGLGIVRPNKTEISS